ncbi:MAG: LLM class flavin-dependent oxidoreductase [Thermomicrobiales bacterium]|nr:LLM class flavin-dependent oxidoreductase [Thermomicrobiales bacterium]
MKIGITLPQADGDPNAPLRYADTRAAALHAEEAGFDSVWIMDHLLFTWGDQPPVGVWEGWSFLAALAEATTRVELGTLVTCTPFRNPALLAKMAAAVDEISDGRLILGLGAGWHEPEFTAFGYPFDHLASRFTEAMRIITPLLREGAVDFHGTYQRASDCVNLPRGPRPGGIPILTGVQGPRLLALTAELADAWNTAWLARAAELPEKTAPMEAACASAGRDWKSLELTVGQIVTFPGLARQEEFPGDMQRHTFSDAADLAREWQRFAAAGVGHIIVWAAPDNDECRGLIADALRRYREGSGA